MKKAKECVVLSVGGGHEAYSCDIIECSGGHPEWHIMQDVLPLLNGNCTFKTMDSGEHTIYGKWDLIIAHPPCTRLCSSGQRWCSWGGTTCMGEMVNENKMNNENKKYAIACDFDDNGIPLKARSCADGKEYDVYDVKDGFITINGAQYPIQLPDGYWIVRKLTVRECARLQTIPEWYDFSCISNTQAYKCIGNGWTVEVIKHLIKSAMNE